MEINRSTKARALSELLWKEMAKMIVGFFHPSLNMCGGAERVAVSMINCLKKAGHQTAVLTNERIDQRKIKSVFGEEVRADRELVFPFEPFATTDLRNLYTDCFRNLFLKRKCDVLIDTQSNGLLPGVNITYIHFPIFGRLEAGKTHRLTVAYFLPYRFYERSLGVRYKRLVFSNSKYTAAAIKFVNIVPCLLYPPVAQIFYANSSDYHYRDDIVVSVSRISSEKRLTLIPHVAKLTSKRIRFIIVGLKQSEQELNRIFSLIQRNNVSDRVEVVTNVSREKLVKILRVAKVFFHPARGEHFGISIAEAMASGCIPIVHDSGGPTEYVPANLRFNGVQDAARKINRVILGWSPYYSKVITELAQIFSESNFSRNFLKAFNSYVEDNF